MSTIYLSGKISGDENYKNKFTYWEHIIKHNMCLWVCGIDCFSCKGKNKNWEIINPVILPQPKKSFSLLPRISSRKPKLTGLE